MTDDLIGRMWTNLGDSTGELFLKFGCLYPARFFVGASRCADVYRPDDWVFKLNFVFTHYVALILLVWVIPPLSAKLSEWLNFPDDKGAWSKLFGMVLFFLVTVYAIAVGRGMTEVLAFTVLGRLGLFVTCFMVGRDVLRQKKLLKKRPLHKDGSPRVFRGRPGAKPWLIIAMGAFDGALALVTGILLVAKHGAASAAVAAGGLVDISGALVLLLVPSLGAELEDDNGVLAKVRKRNEGGSLWLTIFAALLLALGSYSLLVGMMGLTNFIPITIPVRMLAFLVCLFSYGLLRIQNRDDNPWLLLLFGSALFVVAAATALTVVPS